MCTLDARVFCNPHRIYEQVWLLVQSQQLDSHVVSHLFTLCVVNERGDVVDNNFNFSVVGVIRDRHRFVSPLLVV